MNKITLAGTVGKDPVCTVSNDGREIGKFSLAVIRKNNREEVDWFNCVAFGGVVDKLIKPYVHKGDRLIISGNIQFSSYEDSSGIKRSTHSVLIEEIEFTGTKGSNKNEGGENDKTEPTLEPVDDDSLPF